MILNTLLIPVTSTQTAVGIYKWAKDQTPEEWNDAFALNLLAEQYFYIKFIIQLSLVTNGVSLLDGSHKAISYLQSKWYQRKGVHWEDDYEFPLGYN